MEDAKPFWQSKTFWLNTGAAALEVLQMLGAANVIPSGTLTLVMSGVNILLRRFTSQPMRFLQ